MFGLLNVYKPKGVTSHDVIYKLRKTLGIKKIGHAGTLDPMAEGVLPVAIGYATKLIDYLPEDKEYIAKFQLGYVSNSYDTETELTKFANKIADEYTLKSALKSFEGDILQKPPIYSAVKTGGKKLYELARKGIQDVEIPERIINVSKIELLNFNFEKQCGELLISCSKGTYIRSIIHDLGQQLETGAVMTGLIRSKSGGMRVENSVTLDNLSNVQVTEKCMINPATIIPFNCIEVGKETVEKIRHGNSFYFDTGNGLVFILFENEIIAFADVNNNLVKIKKVFIE